MYIGLHVKSDFNDTWIFNRLLKIIAYQISWKSIQLKQSCSVRTETTKLIDAFRNFANAPTNLWKQMKSFDAKSWVLKITGLSIDLYQNYTKINVV